jgi:hypothetical protein
LFTIDNVLDPSTATIQIPIWTTQEDTKSSIKLLVTLSPSLKKENALFPTLKLKPCLFTLQSRGRVWDLTLTFNLQCGTLHWLNTVSFFHKFTSLVRLLIDISTAQKKQIEDAQNSGAQLFNNHAQDPPHLRQDDLNSKDNVAHSLRTMDSKSTDYVPPHLRGPAPSFVGTVNQPAPSHKQVDSTQVSGIEKAQPICSNGPHGDSQYSTTGQFIPPHLRGSAPIPANREGQESTICAVQPISGAKPTQEDAFLMFMNKKAAADAEAKKKSIAERARMTALQPASSVTAPAPVPWAQSEPRVAPAQSNFICNREGDSQFQAVFTDKTNAPAANDKKYTFTGSQKSSQTLPVASMTAGNQRYVISYY